MRTITLGLLVAAAVTVTGCNETARLAKDVTGTWSSAPIELGNDTQGQTTTVETFTFENENGTPGGVIMIESMISQQKGMATDAVAGGSPFAMTVAAKASVSGTWEAIDDDEIRVILDMSSLMVTVDPEAVSLVANPLSGTTSSEIDSLRPAMADFVTADLTGLVKAHYLKYALLDDVKVKENGKILEVEVGKTDMIMRRQL